MIGMSHRAALRVCLAAVVWAPAGLAAAAPAYFPPSGEWARKSPAELGMNAARLDAAVAYAKAHETERAIDFSDQERTTLEGTNDFKRTGYGGPCPPVGRHRYFFKLYALDVPLPDLHRPTKQQLEHAIEGHVLGKTELVGTYHRG
jgi:Raf kinase inhibitor-like YbhB/YbcL family protein